jgi:HPt (histidine-containing phosphotransfer) domain-containing protein
MSHTPGDGPIDVTINASLAPLIPGFMERRREEVQRFRTAVAAADVEALEAMGHTLKGTGGGYGFHYLTDLGREVESGARSGDLESIEDAVARLHDYLSRVRVSFL